LARDGPHLSHLGVPLLHDKVTSSTLRFVVDRVRSKLSSWDARQLSFASRVTLVQSILLSIPMCQPKAHGGLGFRQLKDHNIAFMVKLGFNIVSNANAIWIQVLRSKYRVSSGMSKELSRSRCSFLWRSISKVRTELYWEPPQPEPSLSRVHMGRLLTNAERVRRGCGSSLRYLSLLEWITNNLQNQMTSSMGGSDWPCLFGIIAWHIWKNCNIWVCLNTNGSVRIDEGFAAAGGYVIDHKGEWIIGFARYLGNCSVLEAEL
ncbi:hypothetical protein Gotri_006078, partial [Gossypium trilobum]|nr:hypothetical protein [Gossypium trilobum]